MHKSNFNSGFPKKIVFSLLFVLFTFPANAQLKFGAFGGYRYYHMGSVKGDLESSYNTLTNEDPVMPGHAINYGGKIVYDFEPFSAGLSISYSSSEGEKSYLEKYGISLVDISIPFQVRVPETLIPKLPFRIFLKAAPGLGFAYVEHTFYTRDNTNPATLIRSYAEADDIFLTAAVSGGLIFTLGDFLLQVDAGYNFANAKGMTGHTSVGSGTLSDQYIINDNNFPVMFDYSGLFVNIGFVFPTFGDSE